VGEGLLESSFIFLFPHACYFLCPFFLSCFVFFFLFRFFFSSTTHEPLDDLYSVLRYFFLCLCD